ncbi:MAG: hypothetical protein ACE5G8_16740, partial [Anaerolineae bacterium]
LSYVTERNDGPAHGGITAGLRRAMQTANQWLYRHNTTGDPEKHLVAGAIAAVIKHDDLFVAQVGPAALFSGMNSSVRRYPETSTWLDTPLPPHTGHSAALGLRQFVEPDITHLQIQPGDVLLLADGRLVKHLSLSQVSQAVAGQTAEAIRKNLLAQTRPRNGSAMIVQLAAPRPGAPAVQAKAVHAPAMAGSLPSLPVSLPKVEKMLTFSLPAVLQSVPWGAGQPKSRRRPAAERPVQTNEHPPAGTPDSTPWPDRPAPVVGVVSFLGQGLRTILKLVLPGSQPEEAPHPRRQAGLQARPVAQKHPSRRALQYVAVGLPLAVLAITLLMYWYKGYNRENEYLAALEQAEQKYQQAQIAAPDSARALLDEAEQHLSTAAAIKTQQPDVSALQGIVQERRDEINGVQRLYYVPELRRYTDPGTQLSRIIVRGTHVYVLDRGLNRLFHHTLDDIGDTLLPDAESPVLVQQGQEVDSTLVGAMFDMVWMPAGGNRQTSDLLVLQSNSLLEFDPDWGATGIALSGMEQWQVPVATGSYFGNFYVLDSQANQIYRYLPTLNGYDNPPENYFAPDAGVTLAGAVDMAIDGAIYVLFQDGRIEKYLSGRPTAFQLTGLDTPLKNPTAIFTAPDELVQYLYV